MLNPSKVERPWIWVYGISPLGQARPCCTINCRSPSCQVILLIVPWSTLTSTPMDLIGWLFAIASGGCWSLSRGGREMGAFRFSPRRASIDNFLCRRKNWWKCEGLETYLKQFRGTVAMQMQQFRRVVDSKCRVHGIETLREFVVCPNRSVCLSD